MGNKKALACIVAALPLLFSCAERLQLQDPATEAGGIAATKLIHTAEDAVSGRLLVCFGDSGVEKVESSPMTKSGVRTRSGIDEFDAVMREIGVRSFRRLFPVDSRNEERTRAAGLHRWYVVEFDESADLHSAAVRMAEVGSVSFVEFCRRMDRADGSRIVALSESGVSAITRPDDVPFNDPYLGNQWHYINTGDTRIYSGIRAGADVNCGAAWRLCTGDPRVVVAVVDDAVMWDHPDLAANMWTNSAEIPGNGTDDDGNGYVDDVYGYDFVSDRELTVVGTAEGSHGTHVAGTIAAVNNNGTGVCGIAGGSGSGDGVKVMSCQIFEEGVGGGDAATSSRAIKYAADNGASILQCSWGYGSGQISSDESYLNSNVSVEKQAIDYFIGTKNCDAVDGGIVIFASGNDMMGMSSYPGGYRDFISVTAMSCDYTPAYYTNYGPGCNIAAPGGDAYQSLLESDYASSASQILSTMADGSYGYSQGTSMACPHVSGVAALGLSYALQSGKTFTVDEFNSILLSSVNDINPYCTGRKLYVTDAGSYAYLDLSQLRGKMGSGYIDAYQVLMNIRGTTCIPVVTGRQAQIAVTDYIGDGNVQMSVSDAEISEEDKARLGITSDPRVFGGNILVTCTKTGSGILKVTLQAGSSNGSMFGKAVEKEFALISRPTHPENEGWL